MKDNVTLVVVAFCDRTKVFLKTLKIGGLLKFFFRFTWLPVIMIFVLTLIFGGAALVKAQKQNDILSSKVTKLSQESNTSPAAKVEGASSEELRKSSDSTVIPNNQETSQGNSTQPVVENTNIFSTPTTPSPTSTAKTATKSKSGSVVVSSALPIPTLIPIPTPTLAPRKLATVKIQNLGDFRVSIKDNDTAFTLLIRASQENNFQVSYQNYGDLGSFIDCIGGICGGQNNKYWMFYYNDQFSSVGASSQLISENDITTWKFE